MAKGPVPIPARPVVLVQPYTSVAEESIYFVSCGWVELETLIANLKLTAWRTCQLSRMRRVWDDAVCDRFRGVGPSVAKLPFTVLDSKAVGGALDRVLTLCEFCALDTQWRRIQLLRNSRGDNVLTIKGNCILMWIAASITWVQSVSVGNCPGSRIGAWGEDNRDNYLKKIDTSVFSLNF